MFEVLRLQGEPPDNQIDVCWLQLQLIEQLLEACFADRVRTISFLFERRL
jgi:hypothetical protein